MNYSSLNTPNKEHLIPCLDNISPAADTHQLRIEIDALKANNVIVHTYPYLLIVCDLKDRPALSHELGRQREITFRSAGESTGQSIDIDKYDDYYEQLIIWDDQASMIVGGYRFGSGNKIFNDYGRKGFYIHSFFNIDPAFDEYWPYCIELGRSFIIADYQKKNLPLYLLWKGILTTLIRHRQCRYLIGPVSISRFYSDFSRKVLMEYAMRNLSHTEFSKWFQPKIPYDPVIIPESNGYQSVSTYPDLNNLIDNIRPEHIQFPVLMKQYIRQNARFLGFNLDPNFNDALDGLMILDVADIPPQTLELLQREMF